MFFEYNVEALSFDMQQHKYFKKYKVNTNAINSY